MFIRVTKSPTSKFSKVYLVEGYRDKNGKTKQRIIHRYGNLEELEAKDPDILAKLRAEAKNMPKNEVKIAINLSELNTEQEPDKNYGYFFLESIYKQLEIDKFIKSYPFETKHQYDLDEILRLLVFGRVLSPASKKRTVEHQKEYFDEFDVDLKSVYRSLSKFSEMKLPLQNHLNTVVTETYGRDVSLVFYDVTNYYFEINEEDEFKKNGMSKQNKKTPIVQMGLLIDSNGLPIAYKLFPGNTPDISTLIPFLNDMREEYGFGRVILTADKGLNSGKNLAYLHSKEDGYIVSERVRGASKAFKEIVLDEEGYVYNQQKTFKIKSFLRERTVKDENDEPVTLKEKVIVFWSKNYNDREKHKREKLEERIAQYLENPSTYKASNRYGIKKYLKEIEVDTETGEIAEKKTLLEFEKEKYEQDVALDGYYAIITSEVDMDSGEIIENYRGLWRIEESFRVLKSDLEGRPVYVKNNDHVQGHFLVCFLALLISRILEHRLDHKYSIARIQESLRNATCRKIDNGIYSLSKQDEVVRVIEKDFAVSLNYKNTRIETIRNYKKKIGKARVHNIKK